MALSLKPQRVRAQRRIEGISIQENALTSFSPESFWSIARKPDPTRWDLLLKMTTTPKEGGDRLVALRYEDDIVVVDDAFREEHLFNDPVWQTTLAKYKKTLSEDEYEQVISCTSLDDAILSTRLMQRKYGDKKSTQVLEKLNPFFNRLKNLTNIMGLFASSQPGAVGLVFGSIAFLMELASHRGKVVGQLVDMLKQLESSCLDLKPIPNFSPMHLD